MKVYLDNNCASMVDPQVMEVMQNIMTKQYADPHAKHSGAISVNVSLDQAFAKIRASIHANENSSITIGSDSDVLHCNLITSIYLSTVITGQKNQIIISACESDAVIETVSYLASQGCRVTVLPLNSDGVVEIETLRQNISSKTALVSMAMADSQSGAIIPIDEASQICKEYGVPLHSDATHAVGKIPIDVNMLDIDYLTLSTKTVNGPSGTAMLYTKEGTKTSSLLQTSHDHAGIVGLGKALELAVDAQAFEMEETRELRDMLEEAIREIPEHLVITPWAVRTANTILVGFKDVSSDALVWELNRYGISVSAEKGRATVENIGADYAYRHTLVSFALSRYSTQEEIEFTTQKLKNAVMVIRAERAN